MKKSLLVAFTFVCATSFTAKAGDDEKKNTLEIQAKGSANSTWLFNGNISNTGNSQDYAAGWGYNYGLGLTMYFGNIGIGVEGLMGNHQGGYSGSLDIKDSTGAVTNTKNYTSNVNLKITQIPVLFKLKNEIGGYFEIGPQFNMVSSAQYHYADDNAKMDTTVTKNYSNSYVSVVIGVGFKIPLAKTRFAISGGIRLQYSLTDLKGVDALGRDLSDAVLYPKKAATSAATGGLMLGVSYTIGGKKKEKK